MYGRVLKIDFVPVFNTIPRARICMNFQTVFADTQLVVSSTRCIRSWVRCTAVQRASLLELELFSMLCSHEIFTDQSYHACIRSEKNPSIRSDACMTAYYARGQPASAWPLAGQPCKVDRDLHTIARAHNNTFFVRLIGTLCPHVAAVECVIICTAVHRSCTVHNQNLCQNGTFSYAFSSSSNRLALCTAVLYSTRLLACFTTTLHQGSRGEHRHNRSRHLPTVIHGH